MFVWITTIISFIIILAFFEEAIYFFTNRFIFHQKDNDDTGN
ncbi:hypothetical protein [Lederbergia graminis]|uniref:ATP synthase F0 subunit 8 n=1 Tax=Lederbergia graminis TaxID=735518 RepID=A0ABW0LFQ3_9BACI|nr:hypothetical protein [Bacillaceae bacterium]